MNDPPYYRIGFSGTKYSLWGWISGKLHRKDVSGNKRLTHALAFRGLYDPTDPLIAFGRYDPDQELVSSRGKLTPAIRRAIAKEFPTARLVEF